jgi:hypothetical protein
VPAPSFAIFPPVKLRATFAVGAVLATLAAAAPSQATVTIGPNLASLTPAPSDFSCGASHDCTLMNGSVGAALGSPPLVSPVTGSISRLRLRTGPGGASGITFRLLEPVGGGAYRSLATFGVVPPSLPPNSTTEFPAFPIRAGDAIGVNCCGFGGDNITTATVPGSGNFLVWGSGANPPLEGGETRFPDGDNANQLLMLNADIEPLNGFGVTKQKLKGAKAVATASVFNSGVLTATGKLFKRTTVNVEVPTGGVGGPLPRTTARLVVRAKKGRRARVRRASKAKLRISYTPIFGTASTSRILAER